MVCLLIFMNFIGMVWWTFPVVWWKPCSFLEEYGMPRSVNGLGRGFRDCWTRPERINATRVKMGMVSWCAMVSRSTLGRLYWFFVMLGISWRIHLQFFSLKVIYMANVFLPRCLFVQPDVSKIAVAPDVLLVWLLIHILTVMMHKVRKPGVNNV